MVLSRTPGTTRLAREASGLSDGRGISTGVSPGTMTNTGVPRDVIASCWIDREETTRQGSLARVASRAPVAIVTVWNPARNSGFFRYSIIVCKDDPGDR